jgi:two-component system response regulator HydG
MTAPVVAAAGRAGAATGPGPAALAVLIVDDQRSARWVLVEILGRVSGVRTVEAATVDEARAALAREPFDVALIDIRLGDDPGDRSGLALVGEIVASSAVVPVVVTGVGEMANVRAAMRLGAFDFLLKDDLCPEVVVPVIEELRDRRRLEREVLALRARVAGGEAPMRELVGSSRAMMDLVARIRRVGLSARPVLVTGPTGSGKELVARAIHRAGPNPEAPLLDVNCGSIPASLAESQLFGHERGAFTGAERRSPGLLGAVAEGTLFLDEIGELPLPIQSQLLRVIETGRFRAVGATGDQPFRGRVVAATHRDLRAMVAEGQFREDLFFRLNVLVVPVPALSDRREDIPALVAHFLRDAGRPLTLSSEAMQTLMRSAWPGNVRQLRNLIDRLVVFAEDDLVTPAVLAVLSAPDAIVPGDEALSGLARSVLRLDQPNKLAAMERAVVAEAVHMARGNKSAAARLLGLDRKALDRRLSRPDSDALEEP